MNEDHLIVMLSNLDDDLIEKEINNLMDGVDCNMESIHKKANKNLDKHNKKLKFRKRLPYVAAVCACFICINTVYADEISTAVKSFFNKTPVYSTMVDGQAYYLKSSLVLDDNLIIDSCMVSEDRLDMEFTSGLNPAVMNDIKIVPKNDPNTQYVLGGYSEEGHKYFISFMNEKESTYNIKPFQAFDLLVGSKTYSVTLEPAKSLDGSQKLAVSEATANKIEMVNVGANSIEKNGKQAVQLIASFKDKNMKLDALGQPVDATFNSTWLNLGKNGSTSSSTGSRTQDIYATDKNGVKYKLKVPSDAKAWPVTAFETDAVKDSQLTVQLSALLASYEKNIDNFRVNIPKDGTKTLNRNVDMFAQMAVVKSIKRLSPTSAELVFQLNTGDDKYVSIRSFNLYSDDLKKISAKFSGDTAVMTLEFDQNVDTADLVISWPNFVINGNWTINMK